jgi:hypothetical protein
MPPAPIDAVCSASFTRYSSARTDSKAFAVNPEGHCGFGVTARSLDEAKEEAAQRRLAKLQTPCCRAGAGRAHQLIMAGVPTRLRITSLLMERCTAVTFFRLAKSPM